MMHGDDGTHYAVNPFVDARAQTEAKYKDEPVHPQHGRQASIINRVRIEISSLSRVERLMLLGELLNDEIEYINYEVWREKNGYDQS